MGTDLKRHIQDSRRIIILLYPSPTHHAAIPDKRSPLKIPSDSRLRRINIQGIHWFKIEATKVLPLRLHDAHPLHLREAEPANPVRARHELNPRPNLLPIKRRSPIDESHRIGRMFLYVQQCHQWYYRVAY